MIAPFSIRRMGAVRVASADRVFAVFGDHSYRMDLRG